MAAIAHPQRLRPSPVPRPNLRLVRPLPRRARYAWRRALALAVLVALVTGLFLGARLVLDGVGGGALTAPGPSTHTVGHTYVVQPGDTLWAIARTLHPSGDPRPFVDGLARANGGSTLQPGQQLRLP